MIVHFLESDSGSRDTYHFTYTYQDAVDEFVASDLSRKKVYRVVLGLQETHHEDKENQDASKALLLLWRRKGRLSHLKQVRRPDRQLADRLADRPIHIIALVIFQIACNRCLNEHGV